MPDARPTRLLALVGEAQQAVEVLPLDDGRFQVTVDDRVHVVDCRRTGPASLSLVIDGATSELNVLAKGDQYQVEVAGRTHRLRLLDERAQRARAQHGLGGGDRELRAIMPGKVVAVLVEVGATVDAEQGVLVVEAMKMENELIAPRAGTVTEVRVKPGQAVEIGEVLLVID